MGRVLNLLFLGGAIMALAYLGVFSLGVEIWDRRHFDDLFHFIGGIYAFFFVRGVFYHTSKYHKTETSFWMETTIFLLGALALGVFWEWYELIIDRYNVLILHKNSLMTYLDNIVDLVTDFLGALTAGIYTVFKHGRKK